MDMGFRENLKAELTYQDVKVKELAERTGISKHTIDHYLTANGSQPQVELAVKIARALNVSVEYLVLGAEAAPMAPLSRDIVPLVRKLDRLSDEDYSFVKRLVDTLCRGAREG